MPKVRLTRSAATALRALPPPLDEAALNALTTLEIEAEAGYALHGRLAGVWSLRVGSYRFLYVIQDEGSLVRILAVRHRASVYRSDPG